MEIREAIDLLESQEHVLGERGQWFYIKEYKVEVYLRVSNRYLKDSWVKSLDVEARNCEFVHQGYFRAFLVDLESCTDRTIYVKGMNNSTLCEFLILRGYDLDDMMDSVYLLRSV